MACGGTGRTRNRLCRLSFVRLVLCGNQNFTTRSRHRRDACSMTWTMPISARRNQRGHAHAGEKTYEELSGALDTWLISTQVSLLRVIARKHPHRRVSGSHAGGGKTYFLLVLHTPAQGPEVYRVRCVNYLGRIFTHSQERPRRLCHSRRLRDGVALLLGDGQ